MERNIESSDTMQNATMNQLWDEILGLTWDVARTAPAITMPTQQVLANTALETGLDGVKRCTVCHYLFEPHDTLCPQCAYPTIIRKRHKQREWEHLTLLALIGTYGLPILPALMERGANNDSLIAIISLLSRRPELTQQLQSTLSPLLPPSPTVPQPVWPGAPIEGQTALDTFDPAILIAAFRCQEQDAITVLRQARWENEHGLMAVNCPRCGRRAYSHDRDRMVHRWRCPTNRAIQKDYLRKSPDGRRGTTIVPGCGYQFRDTSGTLFQHRHTMYMADWLVLLYYGPRAIPVLIQGGVSTQMMALALQNLLQPSPEDATLLAEMMKRSALWAQLAVLRFVTQTSSQSVSAH